MKEKVEPLDAPLIDQDHWADPGGRTVAALKDFLFTRTGQRYLQAEVQIITTVAELREIVLGDLL